MFRGLAPSILSLIGLAWCAAAGPARAQIPGQPDSLIQKYRADYAVPDAPALTLLELDEGDLLRPSTVRELAVTLADFTGSGGALQLPKAAAVEFSPGLLFFGRRLKLKQYQDHAAWYRLRVSAASRRQEGNGSPTSLAVALRTSLKDGADLRDKRTNPAFFEQIGRIIARAHSIDAEAEDAAEARGGINEPVVYSPGQQRELNELTSKFKELNASVADTAWNRATFDVAVGLRADAADSIGTDLSVQQLAAWLTYASAVGNWAQWIVGAKMASDRDSVTRKFEVAGSAVTRLYAGTNTQKVYLDLQASKRADEDTEFVLSGGAEINVTSGMWVNLSAGSQWNGGVSDGRFRARFGFKSAFPMK